MGPQHNQRTEVPPIVGPGDRQKDGNHREKAGGAHAARADPDPQFLLGYQAGKQKLIHWAMAWNFNILITDWKSLEI